jgi:hypothetical protein
VLLPNKGLHLIALSRIIKGYVPAKMCLVGVGLAGSAAGAIEALHVSIGSTQPFPILASSLQIGIKTVSCILFRVAV